MSKVIPPYRVIILGAGRHFSGNLPSAITSVGRNDCILDWLLDAFSVLPGVEIDFVAGYKAQDIRRRYPRINYFYNPSWENTGPVQSLSFADLSASKAVYVCYADTVFRREAIKQLEKEARCAVAVDTNWRSRYEAPNVQDQENKEKIRWNNGHVLDAGEHISSKRAHAQFTGLIRLSSQALPRVRKLITDGKVAPKAKLSALLCGLIRNRQSIGCVDLKGDWAELDAPQDLARFVLGTKAESLERLRPLVRKSKIGGQVVFTYAQWKAEPEIIVRQIQKTFDSVPVIVRSSALAEDHWQHSAAGVFQSIADVQAKNSLELATAVDRVFASYGQARIDDQVFVQRMLERVAMSGVVMTRTPACGAPYYIFNFDDTSSRTDTVTSGNGSLRTIIIHRDAAFSEWPSECCKVRDAVLEVERLVGHDALDIEFAVLTTGRVHILQVRPIATAWRRPHVDDDGFDSHLKEAKLHLKGLAKRRPFLAGSTSALSVMADWNPAEMIGTKPNRLALSLYRYLITDETWALQRVQYGYRDVRPYPLMTELLGHPYIDLRVDFNSFIPAALSGDLAHRLVDYYLDSLKAKPQAHDKVEFDIVLTAMSFDTVERLAVLKKAGFSSSDLKSLHTALLDITRRGIIRCPQDVEAFKGLTQRYEEILAARLPSLERACLLLEDAKNIGILHFAHLARNAFVAMGFLKSLVATAILTQSEVDAFLASINTVSGMMCADARRVADRKMAWKDFVVKYGHLRPGTYDITSPCYADAPQEFLRPMVEAAKSKKAVQTIKGFSSAAQKKIARALRQNGMGISAGEFERFTRSAIEGREWGKFLFTRNVNSALKALTEYGQTCGIEPEELSHLRFKDFETVQGLNGQHAQSVLKRVSADGRDAYHLTQAVCLPDLIFDAGDLTCMEHPCAQPNYVTQKKVRGSVVVLTDSSQALGDLAGKIVVVEKADPGFDWIFGRSIAGFITMYGGANSHMAIRAAEFQLPAAVGVGEKLFGQLQRSSVVELDCAGRRLTIVR